MIELLLRVIVTLILAALESLGSADSAELVIGSDPPVPASPAATPAVPIAHGSEHAAAVLSLLRAVDPCGLHDSAAATQITGHGADQIVPVDFLAACQLRLHRQPGQPTWTFTTRVGVAYPAARRDAAAPEEIDGRRMYREESTDPHNRSCSYTRPMGSEFGISLTVSAPLSEPDAQPCPIARTYLRAARSLTRLVLRVEKRTEPRFALASVDPCAATVAVLTRLGASGTAHPQGPYECSIEPDTHPDLVSATPVTVSFGFTTDPTDLARASSDPHSVTVAGRTALVRAGPGPQQCHLTVAYDTGVALQIDHTRFVQTITIGAASCDQATAVTDTVVAAIANR
jgi:hypothetical protein